MSPYIYTTRTIRDQPPTLNNAPMLPKGLLRKIICQPPGYLLLGLHMKHPSFCTIVNSFTNGVKLMSMCSVLPVVRIGLSETFIAPSASASDTMIGSFTELTRAHSHNSSTLSKFAIAASRDLTRNEPTKASLFYQAAHVPSVLHTTKGKIEDLSSSRNDIPCSRLSAITHPTKQRRFINDSSCLCPSRGYQRKTSSREETSPMKRSSWPERFKRGACSTGDPTRRRAKPPIVLSETNVF